MSLTPKLQAHLEQLHLSLRKSLAEAFWSKVNKNGPVPSHCPELGPCWLWTAAFFKSGYGALGVNLDDMKTTTSAHRVAWFLETGKWPDPCALHKCDNRACVRFSHLFEGTVRDNNADMKEKGRLNPGPGKPFEIGHPYRAHFANLA